MKKILITGAKGFLGQNVARYFKSQGYETFGIGHGDLLVDECMTIGLDYWYKSDISVDAIKDIKIDFDLIVHCGGSGSVGFSVEHPYQDFKKTVDGTLEVLEYMRLYNPNAYLIYPSSPAVQGECPDVPIKEEYIGKPASPYGYHKKIAEDLCQSYSEKYSLNIAIIRLFSVYGEGLKKQLLWDACIKIKNAKDEVLFWGTGDETRDFIHVDDAVSMMDNLYKLNDRFIIINGGIGKKHTIFEVVNMIKKYLNVETNLIFNNEVNVGNPQYYWADMYKLKELQLKSNIDFEDGLELFVNWFQKNMTNV
jgi:UDP-glucose 4-epimerase